MSRVIVFMMFLFSCFSLEAQAVNPSAKKLKQIYSIDWINGDVEYGLKLAKKENKPLFLYWGAVWCPPCNQIKKTIFTKKIFQKEMKNFVAIYLDGDDPGAQKWGTHFKSAGYPTMLVLSPEGKELVRMPLNADAPQYVSILKNTRANLKDISEILKEALGQKANIDNWNVLAWYSFEQDITLNLSGKKKIEVFEKLFSNAPVNHIKAHFFLRSILAKNEDKQKATKGDLKFFWKILRNNDYSKNNYSLLTFNSAEFRNYFEKNIEKLTPKYLELLELVRKNNNLDMDIRLSSWVATIDLVKNNNADRPKLSQIQKDVQKWVKKADVQAKSTYERQSIMSTAIWVLSKADLQLKAIELAKSEVSKSVAPYYFMSYLGSLELKRGEVLKGLSWYKKAWSSSKGRATKFQWGSNYLNKMIENRPEDKEEIERTTTLVFSQLLKMDDAFFGRNLKRLKRLKKNLTELKSKNAKRFSGITSLIKKQCLESTKLKDKCLNWLQAI